MLKERSLMIAMDEETLKKHVDALSTDGTVANHFKTKLGLQLSLAPSNKLLDSISKEEAEKGTHLKIVKHLDKNDPSTFIIQPTPWHYSFFGIMKLDKSPTLSPFSLDPKGPQSFPKIKF